MGHTLTGVWRQAADALGEAAFRTGDFAGAEAAYAKVLTGAIESASEGDQGRALVGLGMVLHYRNVDRRLCGVAVEPWDLAAEEGRFEAALVLARRSGDPGTTAAALFGLGLVDQVFRSDWEAAVPRFREALTLVESQGTEGDPDLRAELHRHLGFFHLVVEGNPRLAIRHLRDALELRRRFGDKKWLPTDLEALSRAEAAAGNHARAVDLIREALAEARSTHLRPGWMALVKRSMRELAPEEAEAAAAVEDGEADHQVTGELLNRVWDLQALSWDRYNAHASQAGLTLAEAKALDFLSTSEAFPMRALAIALHQDPSNLTVIVDRLEHRGVVERRRLADKRMRGVVLTPAGVEVRDRLWKAIAGDHPMLNGLDAGQRRTLLDLLRAADAETPQR